MKSSSEEVSLRDLQQALAARLTQRDVGRAATENLNLPALRGISEEELRHSRETLIRKRMAQIASLLPRTRSALHTQYESLAREFVSGEHFDGPLALQQDAIHFAQWLRSQDSAQAWIVELAAWEALHVQWMNYRFMVRCLRFHYRWQGFREGSEPVRAGNWWLMVRFGRVGWRRRVW